MRPSAQRRLAHGPGGVSPGDHDKGRGEGPHAVQVLHNVDVLRRLVLQYGDAVPVADARDSTEHYRPTDGLPRFRHPFQFENHAGLRVRILPAMLHRRRHVQHHHVGLLLGGYVRGSRLWSDQHRDRSCGESHQE